MKNTFVCKGKSFSFPLSLLGISFISWPWISPKSISYPAAITVTLSQCLCVVHLPALLDSPSLACQHCFSFYLLFSFCTYMFDSEAYLIIHSAILYPDTSCSISEGNFRSDLLFRIYVSSDINNRTTISR